MSEPPRHPSPDDLAAFWSWWEAEGAPACEEAIAARSLDHLVDELSRRVHAVSPALVWELGPGDLSEHRLVVSPEGDPSARALARRLLLAAPPATPTWSYADARPADDDPGGGGLRLGEEEVSFADLRVAATRVGHHVDVAVHHPRLRELPEQARGAVMFIALDHALGEIECETWIGGVEPALDPPADGLTLEELRDLVAEVRADALDEDGRPTWVMLQGEHDGRPLMAVAQVPLAPTFAPHLDAHLEVTVPFADATDEGLPTPAALDALRELEDRVTGVLGDSARLVAHETGDRRRLLHLYVDSAVDQARPVVPAVEGVVAVWDQGAVGVRLEPDPGWHAVRHLRT